jgi:CRP-like cAMP-binding protein
MNNYSVFQGFQSAEINTLKRLLHSEEQVFPKNSTIMKSSESEQNCAVILHGVAYLVRKNDFGENKLIDYFEQEQFFSAAFSPYKNGNLYTFVAKKDCTVLSFSHRWMYPSGETIDPLLLRFLQNIMRSVSIRQKIHIDILHRQSIREKLVTCFRYLKGDGNHLRLSFPLSDLSDYLGIDRSAMMREIKKMNSDGMILSKGPDITLL